MTAEVIVARYREPKGPFEELQQIIPVRFYDKFDKSGDHFLPNLPRFDRRAFEGVYHANTPTGREAHTYLYHIIKHYPHFPDHLIFLQGGVLDHSSSLFARIRELARVNFSKCAYVPLGWPLEVNRLDGFPTHIGLPIQRIFERLFNVSCPRYCFFCCASLFIASRARVLSRPIVFYEELMQIIYDEPLAGYVLERLWGVIFNGDLAIARSDFAKKNREVWKLPGLGKCPGDLP